MDVPLVIRQRLQELGLDQKDLAAAAQVTDSYISQLLSRKKAPPAPGRTDLYEKMGEFLRLPAGELSKLADAQRREHLKKRVAEPARPLFKECRDLVLRKCEDETRAEVRRIFEKEAFGELERLVTQKLLDVSQGIAREELRNEEWLRTMAQLGERTYEQMRVAILEFLDADVFDVSIENCVSFIDPMIDSWDIDLKTFAMEVAPNPRFASVNLKRFEFVEQQHQVGIEPGLAEFLLDNSFSGDVTEEEIEFLKALTFKGRRPTALYYYRELQNLRDPLHFAGIHAS